MSLNDGSAMIKNIKGEIDKIPSTTGIYCFAKGKEILYVGKSVNLKARIRSHIENAKMDRKEEAIIKNSDKIYYIVTDSEFKALILESKLIQKYQPKYNFICKDDKSYLYIKITIKDEYPKIFATRRENDGRSLYFGPFPCRSSVNEIMDEIRKIFPYCTQKKLGNKPCFYSKIGLCSPCPSKINLLKDKKLKKQLKKLYRYNIKQIIKVLRGETELVLDKLKKQIRSLAKKEKFEEAMELRNKTFRFEKFIHDQAFIRDTFPSYNLSGKSLDDLYLLLQKYFPHLDYPSRIESYDISNLTQKEATASLVVFIDGLNDKSQYRRFRIKNQKIRSDFEMLEEVLRRRFRRQQNMPNLIIVDGGKPQVRKLLSVLASLKISIPVVGIAKKPDRIVIGNNNMTTIKPPINNLGFNLIRLIRDESHRFAKKYHLYLRKKKLML